MGDMTALGTEMGIPVGMGSAPSQQTRHARRVYVGGLGDVTESEIAEFFTDLVRSTAITPPKSNPVLSVYINPERKFAFVEFNSIELANSVMGLDGLLFKGHPVKVRRPNDYNPTILPLDIKDKCEPLNTSMIPMAATGGGGIGLGLGMGGGMNTGGTVRVFIGGMPPALEEAHLRELTSAFGIVSKLAIIRGPDGAHKGYAFAEYDNPAHADACIAGLNGLTIGDKVLTAARAKMSDGAGGNAAAGGLGLGNLPAMFGAPASATGTNNYPLGGQQQQQAAPIGLPSCLVILEHMVSATELENDGEYREILEDVTTECSKYGRLASVQIPRPPSAEAGKVFLLYGDVAAAVNAATALAGRQFGGKPILARYADEREMPGR